MSWRDDEESHDPDFDRNACGFFRIRLVRVLLTERPGWPGPPLRSAPASGLRSRMATPLSDAEIEELDRIADRTLRGLSLLARVGAKVGEPPIVVGGFAVETYTQGGYVTADIDALLLRAAEARDVLRASGFTPRGRHLLSERLDLAVEFPGHALDTLEANERTNIIVVPGGEVRMIGIDDLIIDRLCALVHGGASGEEENALRLAATHLDRLDLGVLREEARRERVTEVLERVLARAEALR